MKYRIYLIFLFFFIFSCPKNQNLNDDNSNLIEGNNYQSIKALELPISYSKLEAHIGSGFIPVYSQKVNIDTDIDEEIIVACKKKNFTNIFIFFFDLFPSGVLAKKFEFETKISDIDNFSLQTQNLLYENDISFIVEGKSEEKKCLLYLFTYKDNTYKMLSEFSGDYSVFIDFENKEFENKRYVILKDIVTIDNTFSMTNTNLQQKKVYAFNYETNEFNVIETSQILSNESSNNRTQFSNVDKFLTYLNGFWYPEKYEKLITSNSDELEKIDINNIEFIQFSSTNNEFSIKYEDYLNKYSISKMNLLWGHSPGLRLMVKGFSESTKFSNNIIELYLIEHNRMQISGPNWFEEVYYVKFTKPFIEYINDKKQEQINIEKKQIENLLNEEFITENFKTDQEPDPLIINFINVKKEFSIQKGKLTDKGVYKISNDVLGFILTFLFDQNNNTILKDNNNYLIKILDNSQSFSLTPIKIDFSGIKIQDTKKIMLFTKRNKG